MKKCENCVNYSFYKMISINSPYSYCGDIPCLRCKRYNPLQDLYEPKNYDLKEQKKLWEFP